MARIFLAKSGAEDADDEALEALLERLVSEGCAAWPKIAVAKETFVEHLALHAKTIAALEAVHASDLYLACAVCQRDRAALTYFEEQFMARVPDYVLRVRVERDVVDEVQQKLRELLIMGTGDKAPRWRSIRARARSAAGCV